jgi:hypothetical protein
MANQWLFKSETYDNCNCAMNCGCQFNLPTTYGHCQTAYVGTVVEGQFSETPLTGLKWAALYKWPGEIAAGGGTRLLVIDERANEAQRVGLETILSGEACAPLSNVFSIYGSTCEVFLPTLFLPIEIEANFGARTATVHIAGVLTSRGGPLINEFSGEPFHIALARPVGSVEFTYADLALGTTTVTGGLDMSFEETFAMFCVHHFNQDGLISERSRLTAWLGL